ncbi:carbamate kinase [Desemzia sp. C1]|uniref:amino acid kinase family protein n=1 Tax=Desemzia sp. C1 TaxID=2892016 RepID=UPI001E4C9880|nr:carbamate kinase [Desemzia sp. C1]MCI3028416.1 carbamate kinase [Desemzia sp. C1]
MSRIVVALGGNALGTTPSEQDIKARKAVIPIVNLIELGHDVVLAHGGGPQIKAVYDAFTAYATLNGWKEEVLLADCIALIQSGIGYHLQSCLTKELQRRKIDKQVLTVLNQVVVDREDPAFLTKTKIIGTYAQNDFQDEKTVFKDQENMVNEMAVASPKPLYLVEKKLIRSLLDKGSVIIAGGGGGIPVFEDEDYYVPANGIIDKDAASCLLADAVDADYLFILTRISKVALDYGTAQQKNLKTMSIQEAEGWMKQGQFKEGSMLPKIQASIQFVKGKTGRKAIITSLEKSREAVLGEAGTIIYDAFL